MQSHARIAFAICLGLLAHGQAVAEEQSKAARLRAEITALVGPANCANLVNCRVAALGADGCGNPVEFIAYSWLSTEKEALETKIAEYNFAQEDVQAKAPPPAGCVARPQPVAACVNRRCVLPGSN